MAHPAPYDGCYWREVFAEEVNGLSAEMANGRMSDRALWLDLLDRIEAEGAPWDCTEREALRRVLPTYAPVPRRRLEVLAARMAERMRHREEVREWQWKRRALWYEVAEA